MPGVTHGAGIRQAQDGWLELAEPYPREVCEGASQQTAMWSGF